MFTHFTNTLLDDAFDGAAPAGVKNADRTPLPIRQNNRKTIGGLHGY
jgi:hypothetical protein